MVETEHSMRENEILENFRGMLTCLAGFFFFFFLVQVEICSDF